MTFANQSLSLIALQYELALLIGQDLRLVPMLRRFFPPALKLLGCQAGHVWISDEETGIPEHRFGYPSHDIRRLSSNGPLAEAIGSQLAAPDETRTTRLADGGWTHFLPLRERGFCALVRARTPLEPEMQAALVPIFERLATACAACCEHEKTEALRAQAEKASIAKSRFLATMSHELRTPLNGIMGTAQSMLSTETMNEQQRREHASHIYRSGRILLTLLNDILDLSKIEAGGLTLESGVVEPAGMLAEVHSLFSAIARDKLITLNATWHASPELRYEGDPHRLRQMLMNLVSNALKFTDQGEVSIDARPLLCSADASMLEFSVSDTGIGIPPERVNQLFQPFSQLDDSNTRRFGGTGLGLSIVRSLALAMGGETGVESAPGKGARFWFRVRLKALAAGAHRSADWAPVSPEGATAVQRLASMNPRFNLRTALEHIETLLPLLEQSKYEAVERFGDVEALVEGSELANEITAIRPLLEAFRFAETSAALQRLLSKYKTGGNV